VDGACGKSFSEVGLAFIGGGTESPLDEEHGSPELCKPAAGKN
jgi:hypothetical protein